MANKNVPYADLFWMKRLREKQLMKSNLVRSVNIRPQILNSLKNHQMSERSKRT
ncbi:MAG: hypothetical protein V8T08_08965 [Monoglobus pectinilyticus]